MTSLGADPILASIDGARPVFLIVMGICLVMICWRFAKNTHGWSPRLIMAGALLLGFGYAILLPLYEVGKIARPPSSGVTGSDAEMALACHALRIFSMNMGWLLLGLGLAIHTKVLTSAPRRQPLSTLTSHSS